TSRPLANLSSRTLKQTPLVHSIGRLPYGAIAGEDHRHPECSLQYAHRKTPHYQDYLAPNGTTERRGCWRPWRVGNQPSSRSPGPLGQPHASVSSRRPAPCRSLWVGWEKKNDRGRASFRPRAHRGASDG